MKSKLEIYFDRLWPICRSISGNGLRESLAILNEIIPLSLTEVPTGSQVFDWVVPKEWNIRDAWIKTPDGKLIAQFKTNNLHVVNYSLPVHTKVSKSDLKAHMHTIPEMPDAIPYITSYYKENWGFCLSHAEWSALPEGEYEVYIESTLEEGSMTYGECYLPGESKEEILFSTYLCHPSMANNELSGPLVAALLYEQIKSLPNRRYSYRFLFAPETIGVIAFLAREGQNLKENLRAGYVLTCCGDRSNFTYKQSKNPLNECDHIARHILKHHTDNHRILEFSVGGSDERQYCSPGFNLPVGSLMRTPYQQFKEYHTSLDNKDFVSFSAMEETAMQYFRIAKALELNKKYLNKIAHCEPQLGKRGLYPDSVDPLFNRTQLHRLLHFLSYADGETSLIEIAEKRNECILDYESVVAACVKAGLMDN
ncbi:MAG: DUF4910 domain-containing protein [Flavobacteriales bacterium]